MLEKIAKAGSVTYEWLVSGIGHQEELEKQNHNRLEKIIDFLMDSLHHKDEIILKLQREREIQWKSQLKI